MYACKYGYTFTIIYLLTLEFAHVDLFWQSGFVLHAHLLDVLMQMGIASLMLHCFTILMQSYNRLQHPDWGNGGVSPAFICHNCLQLRIRCLPARLPARDWEFWIGCVATHVQGISITCGTLHIFLSSFTTNSHSQFTYSTHRLIELPLPATGWTHRSISCCGLELELLKSSRKYSNRQAITRKLLPGFHISCILLQSVRL